MIKMKNLAKTILIFLSLVFNSLFGQSKDDILPVELIYFEASLVYSGVLLRWGTATEVNNFGFEVQRADSSFQFVGIDFVPGSGNSNSPKHYFYLDTTLNEYGIYHYRLKIIDIDGYFDFSDTIHVLYQPTGVASQKLQNLLNVLFINDSKSQNLILQLDNSNEFDELNLSIYNILGEKIYIKSFPNISKSITFNYGFLSNGIYLVLLHSKNQIITVQKFIVLR